PMMGLSYECEPVMRKLETHFAGQIEFRYVMELLVRNVHDFMMPEDYADTEAESISRYNTRLARIYESEESISGMRIHMDGFCLFSEEQPSSLPLNLAYKAAQLAAPELADRFLYNLRYATIVDTRPTTRLDEILKVVRQTGINEKRYLQHYRDSSAEAALDGDLTRMHALGIHSLPAYLLAYEGKQMLIRHLIGYDAFCDAIRCLSDGSIHPQHVEQTLPAVRQLLERHPLISPIELREALDFRTTAEVRAFVQPLIDNGEIAIREVPHGYFIVNILKEKQI
ncbi:MAG: DsbA family protein, partial [Bacteroidaceae bacterium]|nr:DsbA family protein [Bacteroidaceae bacterium]